MTCYQEKYHRQSIRLPGYDYSQNGGYFITVCTQNRNCLFGGIVDRQMQLNDAGQTARQCWQAIPEHFPCVSCDRFIIMPNHIHGILLINNARQANIRPNAGAVAGAKDFSGADVGARDFSGADVGAKDFSGADVGAKDFSGADVGAKDFSPLRGKRPCGTSKTIGSIVRGFKIGVTKWMRQNTPVRNIWQRNYYEHVIRNEDELNRIRQYIIDNPLRWDTDRDNPHVVQLAAKVKINFEEFGV